MDRLDIALRVHTERAKGQVPDIPRPIPSLEELRPRRLLVIDTETTVDASQRLLFGWYRYLRLRWRGERVTVTVADEGLFYANDLPERDPDGYAHVASFATAHGVRLLSLSEFLDRVFYPAAYKAAATVTGFNLAFDLARLACRVSEGRDRYRGGFSEVLWQYRTPSGRLAEHRWRPRFNVKHLDAKVQLMGFTRTADAEIAHHGHFLDLRALAFAFTDRSLTLRAACELFGVAHGKLTAPPLGVITPELLTYGRRDVEATAELFVALAEEYVRHPLDRQLTRVFSPATVGKSYLRAMGVQPILGRQPEFPRHVLGVGMLAYFGGRAECHVRRLPIPVRYLDFRSMYPTVNALMGLWGHIVAERLEVVEATTEVQDLLARVTPERVLDPGFWHGLVGFVQLAPAGDVLPIRAPYDARPGFQIGVNHLTASEPLWATIPDAVAAALLGRRPPAIVAAHRIMPVGLQEGLQPATLRGAVTVDPRTADFFRRVVEERAAVRGRADLPDLERERLEHFLKVLANSTSYGIYAEMNPPTPTGKMVRVVVQGLDGPFEALVARPEPTGEFYFGPLAAVITGAARLMLGLLERLVADAGGTWAFCDTDSLAVVATEHGGAVPGLERPALSWAQVAAVRERFSSLNPYDRARVPGSIVRLEAENVGPDGRERELWVYVISAKRYALFTLDADGQPVLVKWSEHGLGHLLNPVDPDDADRGWIRQVWEGIVREALGLPAAPPPWLDRPAVGRVTVSSPALLRPFAAYNRGKSYADCIKPSNFLLTAYVRPFGHPTGADPEHFQLFAPYTNDGRQWRKLRWIDRYGLGNYAVTTSGHAGGVGLARVKTYGEVLAEYRVHPEAKSAGPDGRSCGPATRGLLRRRHVLAGRIRYIGKESNHVADVDAGLVHDDREVSTEYVDPRRDGWAADLLPRLRATSSATVALALGVNVSTVKRWKAGGMRPHPKQLAALANQLTE